MIYEKPLRARHVRDDGRRPELIIIFNRNSGDREDTIPAGVAP